MCHGVLRSILLCGSWDRDLLEDGMMYILLYASWGRVVCMFRLYVCLCRMSPGELDGRTFTTNLMNLLNRFSKFKRALKPKLEALA
jgi:hypothetical protein